MKQWSHHCIKAETAWCTPPCDPCYVCRLIKFNLMHADRLKEMVKLVKMGGWNKTGIVSKQTLCCLHCLKKWVTCFHLSNLASCIQIDWKKWCIPWPSWQVSCYFNRLDFDNPHPQLLYCILVQPHQWHTQATTGEILPIYVPFYPDIVTQPQHGSNPRFF